MNVSAGRLRLKSSDARRCAIALALVSALGASAQTLPRSGVGPARPGHAAAAPGSKEASGKGPSSPSPLGNLQLVRFANSAFPYAGMIPETDGKPFLDVTSGARRGHTSPRGGVVWEDQAYADQRSLVFVPRGFALDRPAAIVVFLHGNLATLSRDVVGRQHVPLQLVRSKLNAVLLAPQLATNALDSSAGHFWDQAGFGKYLDEASAHLADVYGDKNKQAAFAHLPVIIVAYSGGYLPAAFSLHWGGVEARIKGVVLLDALFGETGKFADWLSRRHGQAFFVSGYAEDSRDQNAALEQALRSRGIGFGVGAPGDLKDGVAAFVPAGSVDHTDFVTRAWVADPLAALLAKVKLGSPATADAPIPPVRLTTDGGEPAAVPVAAPPPATPYGTLRNDGFTRP